jgi:hypothetical protein
LKLAYIESRAYEDPIKQVNHYIQIVLFREQFCQVNHSTDVVLLVLVDLVGLLSTEHLIFAEFHFRRVVDSCAAFVGLPVSTPAFSMPAFFSDYVFLLQYTPAFSQAYTICWRLPCLGSERPQNNFW